MYAQIDILIVGVGAQRFLIREKTNACFHTVGTFVLGCPIMSLHENKHNP